MVDSIADMLTRIRNAQAVGHKTVEFPFSRVKMEIANILSNYQYIGSVSKKGRGAEKMIEITLKYRDKKNTKPFILGLKRISKPGQRIYVSKRELPKLLKERGLIVLSTSRGLMTAKEAKNKNVGGEVLFNIW